MGVRRNKRIFDYIVIGTGPAGAVIAKSLTDDKETSVLILEAATGFKEILDYNDPHTPLGPFPRWQLYQQPNGLWESSSTAFFSSDIVTPDGKGVNGRKLRVSLNSTALQKQVLRSYLQ